jgi:hypothetical protein
MYRKPESMIHLRPLAGSLLPAPPSGSVIKVRGLDATDERLMRRYPACAMSAGGAFHQVAGEEWNRMSAMLDLVKILAITVDVDLKAHPMLGAALGLPQDQIKKALYGLTQAQIEQAIKVTDFYDAAMDGAADLGFPAEPNRLVFTGHGCCMIYWLDDQSGWADPHRGSGMSKDRIKAVVNTIHEQHSELGLWWWDDKAKDVGTRIFPLPGEFHRNCGDPRFEPLGKWVELRSAHDRVETGWLEELERRFPPVPEKAKRSSGRKSSSRAPAAAEVTRSEPKPKGWSYSDWTPEMAPFELELNGRGSCPKLEPLIHLCFKCGTKFLKRDPDVVRLQAEPPAPEHEGGVVEILTDERGYALFPDESPEVVVIKTGTGSGKTHYMAQRADQWRARNGAPDELVEPQDRWTVLGLAPTKNLATQAAARWGIPYAGANDSRRFHHGSATTCFAAVSTFAAGCVPEDLARCLVIIDELEPQCRQVVSMLKGSRSTDSHSMLTYILAHAGAVIIGDAHASEVTAQILEHANIKRRFKNKSPRAFSTWTAPRKRYEIRYVNPVDEVNRSDNAERKASSYGQHLDLIRHELSLGMRPAIFCASKYIAMALHEVLGSVFPERTGYCVVGGKGTDEYQDLSQEALTADWLIYTTAMSTGVSYDVPGHYSGTHVILEQGFGYLTGPVIEQAIHRVRKPITPTITISGVWTELQDHSWMADPQQVLLRAARKETTCRDLAERLAEIGKRSKRRDAFDMEQLALTQATALASDVRHGLKAVLAWLELHHDFTFYDLPDEVDVGMRALVSEACKRIKDEEAADTAEQVPLKPWQRDQVMARGHRNENERRRLNKTLAVDLYGDAYDGLAVGRKVKTTRRHLFSSLEEEVIIAARVKAMVEDPSVGIIKTLKSDEKRNRHSTFVVSERFSSRVGAVWRVLREIFDSGDPSASSWEITPELAERIIFKVKSGHSGSVLGWLHYATDHIDSLRRILKYAGIKLSNKRTGEGNERAHLLKRSSVDEIFALAEEEHRRLIAVEYQEDQTFF